MLTITLPPEALRSLDLYLAMGDADLGSLSVDDIDLELSMGDLSAKAVRSREFSADMAMGNIQLEQLQANEADFALSMGSLAIDSAAVQELDAEMDMGGLKIDRLEGLREAELELSAGGSDPGPGRCSGQLPHQCPVRPGRSNGQWPEPGHPLPDQLRQRRPLRPMQPGGYPAELWCMTC